VNIFKLKLGVNTTNIPIINFLTDCASLVATTKNMWNCLTVDLHFILHNKKPFLPK